MLARSITFTTLGLEVIRIDLEVDAARGLPALTIVGLPDQAVKEARERVRSAILNSQFELPSQRFIINLAPADLKKEGGVFDLAIALGLLAASGQLDPARLAGTAILGELALDGALRPVRGVLPIARAAAAHRLPLLLPAGNIAEAALVDGVQLRPARTLQDAVQWLAGDTPPYIPMPAIPAPAFVPTVDFADVHGQAAAKRAVEVAIAGNHHVLLLGPPGAGKTMLAERLATILPPLTAAEALEVASIYSVAGLDSAAAAYGERPFRAPHHTISPAALLGGGSLLQPGEISLAHHGVLFLDELPEFRRDALEGLRQPLEEGMLRLARVRRRAAWPARFLLVAAMNPCPCGYLMDARGRCRCPSTKVAAYLGKVSGPLLDRIDLHVNVPAVPFDVLTQAPNGETSKCMQARGVNAQACRRQRGQPHANAQLRAKELREFCPMTAQATQLLKAAMKELAFSARSYAKILKMNRTKICWQITKRVLVELNVKLESVVAERNPIDELPEYSVFLLLGKLRFRKPERKDCIDKPFRRIVRRAVQRPQRLGDSPDVILQHLD